MTKTIKDLSSICTGPEISEKQKSELKSVLKANSIKIDGSQEILKCISGENRLKILILLSQLNEVCVQDLADILGGSISAISHQLRYLRDMDFVETRRCSQTMYYSLKSSDLVKCILNSFGID